MAEAIQAPSGDPPGMNAAHSEVNAVSGPGARLSSLAVALQGSHTLAIAAEVRAVVAAGRRVANLTVGDFDPREFPIPALLRDALQAALLRGETNYPPSSGMPELRRAVCDLYARDLGLRYPMEGVLVAAGARPLVYAAYRTLCDPGDRVVYPVPSWNHEHYVQLSGAAADPVPCLSRDRFLPRMEALAPRLAGARLLCLNTPLNPAGSAMEREALEAICDAVVAENGRRERTGERPLYLLYDQVYRALCGPGIEHLTPPGLRPEVAAHTVLIDAISKTFAATGLRVGWAAGPADVIARMGLLLEHVGAWAPRAEQVATAAFLADAEAVRIFVTAFGGKVRRRLGRLHRGLESLREEGLPVASLPPGGALYLAVRFHPFGRRTPEGSILRTEEQVRRYLLDAAGLAVVPFRAFGFAAEDGWFRASVGAAVEDELEAAVARTGDALRALTD